MISSYKNISEISDFHISGGISSAIANPTDLVKVRMQARTTGEGMRLRTIVSDIVSKEGFVGLYRGVGPTAQRSAVVAAVQLPVYDVTKEQLLGCRILSEGSVCHLVSSIVAATAAAAASNPVDVIRTRMMVQRKIRLGQRRHGVYKSSIECGIHIVQREGAMALYKGFVPAFSRMGPWNIVFFLVYEKLKLLT